MVDVGFYHLQRWPLERALPALLEKVLERGHKAVVLGESAERIADLNNQLWTYNERSWLPHGSAADGDAAMQPIYLTAEEENPNQADILVCIDGVLPEQHAGYSRILDMLDGRDSDAVVAGRERWQHYKDNGYRLTYWQQTESGGWEQKA